MNIVIRIDNIRVIVLVICFFRCNIVSVMKKNIIGIRVIRVDSFSFFIGIYIWVQVIILFSFLLFLYV